MMQDDKAPERITAFPRQQFGSFGEEFQLAPWCEKGKEIWRGGTEYIRADLVESLKANQIPGRCGECGHFEGRDEVSHGVCGYLKCKTEGCTKLYVQWIKNKKDFCNEWKPKE